MAKAVSRLGDVEACARALSILHMRFDFTYPAVSYLTAKYSRAIQYSITFKSRAARPTHPLDVIIIHGSGRLYSDGQNPLKGSPECHTLSR